MLDLNSNLQITFCEGTYSHVVPKYPIKYGRHGLPIPPTPGKRVIAALVLIALSAISAQGCDNYRALLSHDHLDIGVRFDTNAKRPEAIAALNYWAERIDMTWHESATDCAIEFRPAEFGARRDGLDTLAMAHAPRDPEFNGVVYFRLTPRYDAERVFIHEIGHLLGLEHSSNPDSPMYFVPGGGSLTVADARALSRRHALITLAVAQ